MVIIFLQLVVNSETMNELTMLSRIIDHYFTVYLE